MTTAAILHLMWPGNGFTVSKKSFFSCLLFGKMQSQRNEEGDYEMSWCVQFVACLLHEYLDFWKVLSRCWANLT